METTNKPSETPLVAIVDDDLSVRDSTRRLLRCFGLKAEAFPSAEAFLQSERLPATACLLLDVRMPGMDGLELQQRLAQTGRCIPILFLSARANQEEEQRALRAGAAGFLRKPMGKEDLLYAIAAVLAFPDKQSLKPA